jgi:O-antigen/teichoic acid export membrane protein
VTAINGNVVGRGAAYIFVETMVGFLSGVLLWLVLTRITSSEVIGTSSTVISLATIFTIVGTIGIPEGASRFLSKSFHEKDLVKAGMFLKSSLFLISIGVTASTILLWLFKDRISVFQSDPELLIFAIIIIGSSALGTLFYSTILATLKTKGSSMVLIIASCSRTAVVIILVLANLEAFGIVIGYAFSEVLACLLLALAINRVLRREAKSKSDLKLDHPLKTVVSASVPYWIPRLIAVLGGANLGTVVVFGSSGSTEAASYFLANSILSATLATVTPLHGISYPALSAMNDGRKRFAWRIIKISTIISVPLSLSILFYSNAIIDVLGQNYAEASLFLRILLITVIPSCVSIMVIQLSYAYGNYRQVLYLGLASSIPRTLLYFIIVPSFGGTGAAASFLIGSMMSFVLSLIIAKKIGLIIHWGELGLIVIISLLSALLFSYFEINFVVGIISTIVISVFASLRFKILSKSEVEEMVNVLPEGMAIRLNLLMNKIGKVLNKDY